MMPNVIDILDAELAKMTPERWAELRGQFCPITHSEVLELLDAHAASASALDLLRRAVPIVKMVESEWDHLEASAWLADLNKER